MQSFLLIFMGVILGNLEGGISLFPEWSSSCQVRTDSSILWIVGDSGKVVSYIVEEDSIPNFIEAFALGQQYKLNDVFFWDELNGWIVGYVNDQTGDQGKGVIWRTVNGGQNWIPYPEEHLPQLVAGLRIAFTDVVFYSRYIGFVECDSGYLLKTIDGGVNWTLSRKTQANAPQVNQP